MELLVPDDDKLVSAARGEELAVASVREAVDDILVSLERGKGLAVGRLVDLDAEGEQIEDDWNRGWSVIGRRG